jgi:hypothetical protein
MKRIVFSNALGEMPMWLPETSHLAMDSVSDRGVNPMAAKISRATMVKTAVSIPKGQKTAQRLHCEHW